jgi:alpha-tubulin suppressor-like RCC1 family protein
MLLGACSQPVAAPTAPDDDTPDGRVLAVVGDYSQLAAGFVHTCALTTQGTAVCWGNNDYHQLGSASIQSCGGRPCSTDPVAVQGNRSFMSIAAGWTHTCGVSAQGEAYCWGGGPYGGRGLLGNGILSRSVDPVRVDTDSVLAAVTLGDGHSCALTDGGTALCWGQNDLGQLGDGTSTDRRSPVPVASSHRFRVLSAGAHHTCGVTVDGMTMCWGDNRWGQVGAGTPAYNAQSVAVVPTVVEVPAGSQFTFVVAGWEHTCALTGDGTAFCWGRNDDASQLGDASGITHRGVPGPVRGGLRFASLVAGALNTCGKEPDGTAYCWGGNYYDVLGLGATHERGVGYPVRADGGPFLRITLGQAHACGLATDRKLRCWGDNSAGQY